MGTNFDPYAEVVSRIQDVEKPVIAVPRLSSLLGVKAPTLNARFRRLQIPIQTVGRVNFVSRKLALKLAELHKYALLGWPTVQQASRLTAVKGCTIKAKCEQGRVEGYLDLTKRLRINPDALTQLRSTGRRSLGSGAHSGRACSTGGPAGNSSQVPVKANGFLSRRGVGIKESPLPNERMVREPRQSPPTTDSFGLHPDREPRVRLITAKDYGMPELTQGITADRQKVRTANGNQSEGLCYEPDRPFSLSECAVGRRVKYEDYYGTIVGILDEPFNPMIRVSFPEHQHPLMREVLLVVERRRT